MRSLCTGILRVMITATIVAAALPSFPAHAGGTSSDTNLKKQLKKARKDTELREKVRIDVEGNLDQELRRLTIYGRGLGIWNAEGQFSLKSEDVVDAIDLLLDAKFFDMPERFAYPEDKDEERDRPVQLIRMVTVTVGEQSKTVIQDNKGPKSEPFAKLTSDLVGICRKPAATLVAAANLSDGLEKVANGTLGPETLTVAVNAPELRSLESQDGQGWQLSIRNARLELTSVTIANGVKKVGERALQENEIQKLARELLEAGAPSLPSNINTEGYTQLTVAVLNQKVRTMARTFAGEPGKEDEEAAATFHQIREQLHTMYEKGLNQRSAD